MNSEDRDDSLDAGLDPYDAPSLRSERKPSPLSRTYWIGMWVLLLAGAVFFVSSFYESSLGFLPFSTLVVLTSFFTLVRSAFYSSRVRAYEFAERYDQLAARPLRFFFQSMGLGLLISVASIIAFLATCMTAGGILGFGIEVEPTFMNPRLLAYILMTSSGLIGILAGSFLVWLTLPRVPKASHQIVSKQGGNHDANGTGE